MGDLQSLKKFKCIVMAYISSDTVSNVLLLFYCYYLLLLFVIVKHFSQTLVLIVFQILYCKFEMVH